MKNKLLNLIITTLLIISSFTVNTVNAKTDITSNSNKNDNTNEVLDNSYNTALPSDIIKSNTPQYIDDDLENTTIVSGKKTWIDGNNNENTRPSSIIVNLLANGEPALDDDNQPIKIEVTENDEWQYTFDNLPKYDDNDNLITYSVSEDKIEGYIAEYKGNDITNYQTITIKGKKIWDDFDNEDGYRPDFIQVTLWVNNKYSGELETIQVSEDDNWEYEFKNLKKYDSYGYENIYGVNEHNIYYYETYVKDLDIYNIQQYKRKDIKIKKVDGEGNPIPNTKFDIYEYITLGNALYPYPGSSFYDMEPNVDFYHINKYSLWQRGGFGFAYYQTTFFSPSYLTANRDEVFYKHGYFPIASIYTPLLKFKDGTTLLDILDEYGYIPDEYGFDDIDYKNTEWHLIDATDFMWIAASDTSDGYRFSVKEDLSDIELTQAIHKQLDTDVYRIAWAILDGHGGIDYPEELILKVVKLIEDRYIGQIEFEGNPINSTLDLYSKHKIGEFTTDENGEICLKDMVWSNRLVLNDVFPWNIYRMVEVHNPNLIIVETQTASDKYILDPSEYTIDVSKEDEIVITNKYVTTDITINKKWIDNDNKDKSRPDSIEVNVLANDEVVETITLSKDEDYSYTLENMPKYKDGELIKYTIEEVKVPDNYEVSYEIDQENYSFTITNTYHKQKPEPKPDPKPEPKPTPKPRYDIPKTGID